MNKPIRILLADDDACLRRCLKYVMESDGVLSVSWEADNGIQAVALAQQHNPDVIVLDAQTSRMTGLEATRCIKSRNPDVKIVIMGLYQADRQEALQAGADEFIVKDSGCEVFRQTIYKLFSVKTA